MKIVDIHLPTNPDENTARLLRAMRKSRGMSQLEVAEKIGVSRTAYLKYESGKGGIPGKSLTQLADLFRTTTDYLLGRPPQKATERVREAISPPEYLPRRPAREKLVSLIGGMSDDSIEIMLGIAEVIKAKKG